jgi:hypothetical protein
MSQDRRIDWVPRIAVVVALLAAGGCGGTMAKNDGAANDGGTLDVPLADTGHDQAPGPDGGTDATGGADVGGGARDCFPECIAALRRSCERPAFGSGSCSQTTGGGITVICYSNGVHETRVPTADGGVATEFTQTDGQTLCYRVIVNGTSQSFQTPSGQEVAQVVATGGGMYSVTCGGTTVTVDGNDPTCRTLNSADCTTGVTCP